MMTKQEARAEAKMRRRTLDLAAVGAAMAQQVFSLPAWQAADTVFCFVPMRDEPDTLPILRRALADGKRLCVPRCLPGGGRMEAVEITALAQLKPGRYGILEPPEGCPAALTRRTLALIPCLAADRHGTRLGRGAGYYDRFLREFAALGASRLLVCPQALIFDVLPCDEWDIPFSSGEILTENGVQ